jgi:hypothetical protein
VRQRFLAADRHHLPRSAPKGASYKGCPPPCLRQELSPHPQGIQYPGSPDHAIENHGLRPHAPPPAGRPARSPTSLGVAPPQAPRRRPSTPVCATDAPSLTEGIMRCATGAVAGSDRPGSSRRTRSVLVRACRSGECVSLCPSTSWMVRMSTPSTFRWVASEWRKVRQSACFGAHRQVPNATSAPHLIQEPGLAGPGRRSDPCRAHRRSSHLRALPQGRPKPPMSDKPVRCDRAGSAGAGTSVHVHRPSLVKGLLGVLCRPAWKRPPYQHRRATTTGWQFFPPRSPRSGATCSAVAPCGKIGDQIVVWCQGRREAAVLCGTAGYDSWRWQTQSQVLDVSRLVDENALRCEACLCRRNRQGNSIIKAGRRRQNRNVRRRKERLCRSQYSSLARLA